MVADWLMDQVMSKLASPRNVGIVAFAGAMVSGALVAKVLGWFSLPKPAQSVGGLGVAAVLVLTWQVPIVTAAQMVAADLTTTSISTTVTGESQGFTALRCGGVEPVLNTIRTLESGNQYGRLNGSAHTGATASGAYQYTNGTWNNYGGYKRAMDAPPEVQDERARGDVTRFLAQHDNDVSVIPVLWYIGHVPSAGEWDSVPWASQGNTLTPRQYQTKWLNEYERQTAACGEV